MIFHKHGALHQHYLPSDLILQSVRLGHCLGLFSSTPTDNLLHRVEEMPMNETF